MVFGVHWQKGSSAADAAETSRTPEVCSMNYTLRVYEIRPLGV